MSMTTWSAGKRPPLTPPCAKVRSRNVDLISFLPSSKLFSSIKLPQSTSSCRKSATTFCCFDRLVEVMVVQLAQPRQSPPLIRLRAYTVTSSSLVTVSRLRVSSSPNSAICFWIVSCRIRRCEQYDRQHRDCRELHPPEAQVCWLADRLLRLVVQLPSDFFDLFVFRRHFLPLRTAKSARSHSRTGWNIFACTS